MKRFLMLALGVALAVATFAETSHAQGQRLKSMSLFWQTNGAVNTVGGIRDTTYFCTAGTQLTYDTTSAFPTGDFELPRDIVWGGTVDTLQWFNLRIKGLAAGDGVVTGFDSLLVQAQVSTDGRNWVSVTPNRVFDATRTAGNALAAIIVGASTNGDIVVPFWQRELLGKLAPAYITATDILMWGWPQMRFIVNTSGAKGCFTGEVIYLSSLPD